MKALRYLIPGGLFVVLVGFFIVGLQKDPSVIPSPLIGKPAPQFTLPSLDDPATQVTLAAYAGKPYLLNVWGTWCGGCREEHAVLLEMKRSGAVPIVGLDWKDERAAAQQWLTQLGNPYDVVAFDQEGKAAIDWGVYGAPETFLIGKDGKVLHKQIGIMTMEAWNRDFLPRIAKELGQ
ncbi:MAG: DsbE family thiol:disulfide interchange protein [Gammaproteobacteria bacterium]|nr:DsbE family thiol:disulfide interchange protein [Gammaproteobacteria bacterium]